MNEYSLKIMKCLKKTDYLMLRELYLKRCLSVKQAWALFYKDKGISYNTFRDARVIPLNNHKIIKIIHTGIEETISLTNAGIEIVRFKFDLPTLALNGNKKIARKGLTESALTLHPKLINHQINLNQFVLMFEKLFKKRYPDRNYEYFDEKYVSKYRYMRPDGMLSIGNTDLFLEMDMGTESKKQLLDKFTRYRQFLGSQEFQDNNSKVIILFILKTANEKLQSRKDLVRYSIMQTLTGAFPEHFDIYIGTQEELLSACFNKLLPIEFREYKLDSSIKSVMSVRHQFTTSSGRRLKNFFYDSSFRYYVRKLNKNNKIIVENGVVQEFLMDEYYYSPLSVLSKLTFFEKTRSMYQYKYKRMLSLIVILTDIKNDFRDLQMNSLLSTKGVYFTTFNRLNTMPLYEALFVMDNQGNIRHFTDNSYMGQVYEGTIEVKEK